MTTVSVSLREAISRIADEAFTVGRIYNRGGEKEKPAEMYDRLQVMIDKELQALASAEQPSEGDVGRGVHPEDFCDKCGGPNICWFAPNEIWNEVVANRYSILCPICFVRLAEEAGFSTAAWQVSQEPVATTPPQEPVAWMIEDFRSPARFSTDPRTPVMAASRPDHLCTPLYTNPPANDEAVRLDADRLIAAFVLEHQAGVAPKDWYVLGTAQTYLREKYGTLWHCRDELREKPSFATHNAQEGKGNG